MHFLSAVVSDFELKIKPFSQPREKKATYIPYRQHRKPSERIIQTAGRVRNQKSHAARSFLGYLAYFGKFLYVIFFKNAEKSISFTPMSGCTLLAPSIMPGTMLGMGNWLVRLFSYLWRLWFFNSWQLKQEQIKKRQENQCARTGKRIDWTLEEVENRWAGTRHRAYDAFRITRQAMILFSPFIIPPGWQPIITGTVLIGSGSIRPALLIEDFSRLFPAAASCPPCVSKREFPPVLYRCVMETHGTLLPLTPMETHGRWRAKRAPVAPGKMARLCSLTFSECRAFFSSSSPCSKRNHDAIEIEYSIKALSGWYHPHADGKSFLRSGIAQLGGILQMNYSMQIKRIWTVVAVALTSLC